MALAKPGTERDVFWDEDSYGPLDCTADAVWRRHVYEARHLGAILLDLHRLGNEEGVQATYENLAMIVGELAWAH